MKYRYNKRKTKKGLSNIWIFLIIIVLLATISTGYAMYSQTLTINGTVTGVNDELPDAEVIVPDDSGTTTEDDRLTTNTKLSGGWLNVDVFTSDGDEQDGNMVITKLKNGTKTWKWFTKSITVTFELTIKNNSGDIYTNGKVEKVDERDTNTYITPSTPKLSSSNVSSGDTVTISADIVFTSYDTVPVGDYVLYKITFDYKGSERYYYYKILISG